MGLNNTNHKVVDRFCQSLDVNKEILKNFDYMAGTIGSYGKHKKIISSDLHKIVVELMENKGYGID